MKRSLLLWLTTLCSLALYAQSTYTTIKVSKDIEVIKLSDHAYIHISYLDMPNYGRMAANGLIFTNGEEAFLFDTPWNDSLTMDLYNWCKNSLHATITGFVPNHWHVDCMGGLGFLQQKGIASFAHQMTIEIARTHNLPLPDHGFTDSLQLNLGDKTIMGYYPGPAHSLDNIVVWIPSEKILFAGCIVKSMDATNLGNTADGDLSAYPGTIDKLLVKFPDAKIIVPGHGNPGGIELIKHTREMAGR